MAVLCQLVSTHDSVADGGCWFKFNTPSMNVTSVQLHVNAAVSSIQLYEPNHGPLLTLLQLT